MQADVLLVTVTSVETQAVREVFNAATGQNDKAIEIDEKMYRDLGTVNGARVFMVRSEMGAIGPGAALSTVPKGIKALSPAAVIMVGIAFGVDSGKQAVGNILVSKQLMLYDLQRVGTSKSGELTIVPRGDRVTASTWLLDRLRSAGDDWDQSRTKVQFGLILSGEKLVDNMDFRQQILALEREAIGGEMEAAGLYVACQDAKVDWILVKGICDWADGKKEEDRDQRQQLAAGNAAAFVLHALQQAPLKHKIPALEPPPPAPRLSLPPTNREAHSSLPRQPYFFGRKAELDTIADALAPESRSWGVLVDGPGGIGKTALAVRAAYLAPDEQFPVKIFLSAKKRDLTPAGEQPLEDFMLPNYLSLLTELAKELGDNEISRTPPNERANAVRRMLGNKDALIVIDNVESFDEPERFRLYQFLARLPGKCKAIVTSRRRTDIDARVIRLERLSPSEATELITELAKTNKYLKREGEQERRNLYEVTQGNPLLIKWAVAQLGRSGSKCRTIADAYEFLKAAPEGNDPLEYIFGDLLDTFTESETAVLAALVHFKQPAKVEWIAELAELPLRAAQTALEDLTDRALLVSDEESHTFLLPALAATFLRRKRPEAVALTADRLADRAYALILENGGDKYDAFPRLEAEWPAIAAALPVFIQGDNARLQSVCNATRDFLDSSGSWDEWLSLSQQAEEKAIGASDFYEAGWRAYDAGWVYHMREQSCEVLLATERCEEHWKRAQAGARETAIASELRGHAFYRQGDYSLAITTYQKCLELSRALNAESEDVSISLNYLANAESRAGAYDSAERDYRESLRIAKKVNNQAGVVICTGNLAGLAIDRQDWPKVELLAREALAGAEGLGRLELIASNCDRLAQALSRLGRRQEGLPFARRAVDIYTRLGKQSSLKDVEAVLKECEGGS